MKFLFQRESAAEYNETYIPRRLKLVQAFLVEHQRAVLDLPNHAVAGDKVTLEDPLRQRIFNLRLNRALQGPRAIHRIEAGLADSVTRLIIETQGDIALRQALAQAP